MEGVYETYFHVRIKKGQHQVICKLNNLGVLIQLCQANFSTTEKEAISFFYVNRIFSSQLIYI